MDGEARQATVCEVAKSRTQLSRHTRWDIPESVWGLVTPGRRHSEAAMKQLFRCLHHIQNKSLPPLFLSFPSEELFYLDSLCSKTVMVVTYPIGEYFQKSKIQKTLERPRLGLRSSPSPSASS